MTAEEISTKKIPFLENQALLHFNKHDLKSISPKNQKNLSINPSKKKKKFIAQQQDSLPQLSPIHPNPNIIPQDPIEEKKTI